ncbi:hypothetical protein J5N97_009523 [Dioscorea zingiberensis]|uniref:Uncharacterized protein n=1 Tax=Dioscorea zingiberensis TaxID=325984 RepID=A0A9D5CXQ0_9LILI|nr:hypothetical protein J5N97_009523 [Dioscorea zingiberensis]
MCHKDIIVVTLVYSRFCFIKMLTYIIHIFIGTIKGKKPPPRKCNQKNNSECCKEGETYQTYTCSPPVTNNTKAILTINGFEKGEDGGAPSECDNKYHSNGTPVVAMSTGWLKGDGTKRCLKYIRINGNGQSVVAKVVDECDSTMGCDFVHDYQPPCDNNIVDASLAVWVALGVPKDDRGWMEITWSDV